MNEPRLTPGRDLNGNPVLRLDLTEENGKLVTIVGSLREMRQLGALLIRQCDLSEQAIRGEAA